MDLFMREYCDICRKDYKRKIYADGAFRNIVKSVGTDTGFNVICASCAEYKSKNACTGIQVLS